MSAGKYRLVTRSDFDGLVCAAIMRELGMIDEIKFVHPKDMQDGVIEITNRDITTNLPYVEVRRVFALCQQLGFPGVSLRVGQLATGQES